MRVLLTSVAIASLSVLVTGSRAIAQTNSPQASATVAAAAPPSLARAAAAPGYVIGPDDVLSITFWHDKDMSADAVVRPDGNISLPLLNDIHAAGLTPEQLRLQVAAKAEHLVEAPAPTVVVKEIHSRNVFVTGQVEKPGTFPLAAHMTVVQVIALAGGLKEFADEEHIVVMRNESGRQLAFQFNYKDVLKSRNLRQNIELKPGDTVAVP